MAYFYRHDDSPVHLTFLKGVMPTVILETTSHTNRRVCDDFYGGAKAKRPTVFLRCKMSLMALRDISLSGRCWRYSGHRDALAVRRLGRL